MKRAALHPHLAHAVSVTRQAFARFIRESYTWSSSRYTRALLIGPHYP